MIWNPPSPLSKLDQKEKCGLTPKDASQEKNGDESGYHPNKRRTNYLFKIIPIRSGVTAETQANKEENEGQVHACPEPNIFPDDEGEKRGSGDDRHAKHR